MKVLIIGGAGMLGKKLTSHLAKNPTLQSQQIDEVILFDVSFASPERPSSFSNESIRFSLVEGDLRDRETLEQLINQQPDVIFHLAAVVSGEAENDFEKGYSINLDGTRSLLEAIRSVGYRPKLIFASSIAVFGAPFPDAIPDDYFCTPLTSYGTQKAICELLISDYSRRDLVDGLALRLPTICVRPGKPNAAASGFFSNIIREPLAGQEAVLPVDEDVMHWHASPRAAVGYLVHAANLDTKEVGTRRAITMPGLAVTVAEQLDALRSVAGQKVVARVRREPDPFIQKMVAGWPRRFSAQRAKELGFRPDASFADIIRYHIEDELNGQIA